MKAKQISKLNLDNRTSLQDVIPLETPFLLYVDPSSACNFRCQFCPSGHKDLIDSSGYRRGIMRFELFEKIILDIGEFEGTVKVLRLNKVGEPLLNKNLPKMVYLAKMSGKVEYIDLATNASLFTRDLLSQLLDAGLDRLNISLEGINREQYIEHAKVDVDFHKLIEHIIWLNSNKGSCEITIKAPGNYLSNEQKSIFYTTFGDHCDRIFVEDIAPIWPHFDVEGRANIAVKSTEGQYSQPIEQKEVCTYIFYAAAINADGTVSACCPDWGQKLIVGDLKKETLKSIWNSEAFNALRCQHLEGRRCDNYICYNCGHIKYSQIDNIDQYREMVLRKFVNFKGF